MMRWAGCFKGVTNLVVGSSCDYISFLWHTKDNLFVFFNKKLGFFQLFVG